MKFIVDAHQDLAWNMLTFGRDYCRSAHETRRLEADKIAPKKNGHTLLGWPEYKEGYVAVIFSTLFAAPGRRKRGSWDTQCYYSQQQAHRQYREQADAYQRLGEEHPQKFHLIYNQSDLAFVLKAWREEPDSAPVGLVLLLEGADGVESPEELAGWWEKGLRILGLAWAGNSYCGGTHEPGGLTTDGYELLEEMATFNFSLDISHMDERAVLESLDFYPGPILASHANAKALLKDTSSNRHLSDRVIQGLVEREGVIGVIPYNRFLNTDWDFGDQRADVTLDDVFAHIDHICQLAGNAHHVGIGSDFDGGFGLSAVPAEIDTIADLQKLVPILAQNGYTQEDIASILGKNWLNHLKHTLP